MQIPRPGRSTALLVTGILAVGCSRDAERSPTLETVSSATTPARVADTTPPRTDTTTPVAPQSSPRLSRPAVPSRNPPLKPAKFSTGSTPAESAAQTDPEKWLSYDAATNTVTFELIAGPFTFNGYRNGEATLVVPPKANVVMNFVNKDGTPHSAIVISGDGPIPNSADDPAIPRAYTNKVLEGLPQEGSDVMRFPVPESGRYRIFCGVPGHGLSGMWLWMRVDPAAKVPSFGPTKA